MLASTGIGSVQLSAGRLEARGAHQRANVMRLAYVPEHSVSDPSCMLHHPSTELSPARLAGGKVPWWEHLSIAIKHAGHSAFLRA